MRTVQQRAIVMSVSRRVHLLDAVLAPIGEFP